METRIATSIEQSKKLIELGVDVNTADMDYIPFANDPKNYDCVINLWNNEHEDDWIPAWSLSALLKLIPITCILSISNGHYRIVSNETNTFFHSNPLDAVYEMVYWLKENKKI